MTEATSPARELSADELMALMIDAASLLEGEGRQNIPAILRAAASLIRELTEREKALREALAEADELIAPMAACGAIVPDHAWDDDWYTLDSPESFDKAEMKFFASTLRRAVKFRRAAKLVEPQ